MVRPAITVIVIMGCAGSSHAQVWDLATDWSDTANPNGAWSYNAGAAAIAFNWPNWAGSGVSAWAAAQTGFGHIPSWGKTPTDLSCQMLAGDVFCHANDAGNGTDVDLVNVTWTSPARGAATVTGAIWWFVGETCCSTHCGRTMNWSILFNEVEQDTGNIGHGDAWSRATPRTFTFEMDVQPDDVVELYFQRTHAFGTIAGVDLTVSVEPTPCPGDIVADDTIDIQDLLALLAAWGPCDPPCPPNCAADVNEDCVVGIEDLLILLSVWGACTD